MWEQDLAAVEAAGQMRPRAGSWGQRQDSGVQEESESGASLLKGPIWGRE